MSKEQMSSNDLYYADSGHLLGVTADRRIIRNIERSTTRAHWRLIGISHGKVTTIGEVETYRYLIPLGGRNKQQAERVFKTNARILGKSSIRGRADSFCRQSPARAETRARKVDILPIYVSHTS